MLFLSRVAKKHKFERLKSTVVRKSSVGSNSMIRAPKDFWLLWFLLERFFHWNNIYYNKGTKFRRFRVLGGPPRIFSFLANNREILILIFFLFFFFLASLFSNYLGFWNFFYSNPNFCSQFWGIQRMEFPKNVLLLATREIEFLRNLLSANSSFFKLDIIILINICF